MQSNFSDKDRSSFNGNINQLEWMFERLELHSAWSPILLKEQRSRMTGIVIARKILRERDRTDIKICCNQDEENWYSPRLNFIGLSEAVAGSRSAMAAAIVAHEIGHAFEPSVVKKLGGVLRKLFIPRLAVVGELLIISIRFCKLVLSDPDLRAERAKLRAYTPLSFREKLWQTLECCGLINPPSLGCFLRGLVLFSCVSMYFAATTLIGVLLLPIQFLSSLVGLVFGIPILSSILLLSVCCAFVCRFLSFLIKLQASWWALRLLEQHNVLNDDERRAAREFLLAAALTRLCSPSQDLI